MHLRRKRLSLRAKRIVLPWGWWCGDTLTAQGGVIFVTGTLLHRFFLTLDGRDFETGKCQLAVVGAYMPATPMARSGLLV